MNGWLVGLGWLAGLDWVGWVGWSLLLILEMEGGGEDSHLQ